MTATEKKVKECLEPIINNLGYELYDVIYEKEAQENYLRIFIDKTEGISLNDCENVNNSITDILDEKDFIKNAYMLEVSSPGIERRIREDKHLEQSIGKKVEVHTFKPIGKQKVLIGILKKYDENSITIEESIENVSKSKNKKKGTSNQDASKNNKQQEETAIKITNIEKSNISTMKTVYNWNE